MAQTKSEIKALLDAAGIRPRRRFGQNFLIDGNLMAKIPEAAEITSQDVVLEVGCGTGGLTDLMIARARHVVGVEIDAGLARCLQERFDGVDQMTLVHADILSSKSVIAPGVLDTLRSVLQPDQRPLLVANLPYNIATPLMANLLTCGIRFKRYCVAVQREVCDRMAATGGKDYGPISVALQACGTVRRVLALPRQAFWPPPQIESAVVRVDLDFTHLGDDGSLNEFVSLVRQGFGHRRKTLHYNLRQKWSGDQATVALATAGIDARARAEAVDVSQWLDLYRALSAAVD